MFSRHWVYGSYKKKWNLSWESQIGISIQYINKITYIQMVLSKGRVKWEEDMSGEHEYFQYSQRKNDLPYRLEGISTKVGIKPVRVKLAKYIKKKIEMGYFQKEKVVNSFIFNTTQNKIFHFTHFNVVYTHTCLYISVSYSTMHKLLLQ